MSKKTRIKVAGYVRISTQEQASGHGLEYQEQAIREYCKTNNLELTKIYSDIESGTKKNRKGFNQLISDQAEYDGVVVYHTDRISRKLEHLLQILDHIAKSGKVLLSTSQPELSLTNPTGKLVFSILGAVSEFELSRITERLVNGRMIVKQKAKGTNLNYGKRPGYAEKKQWTINPDGTVTKSLVKDEEALKTIELIKRHRRSGKSYLAIAKYLNAQGIPNKSGKPWNDKTVKALSLR